MKTLSLNEPAKGMSVPRTAAGHFNYESLFPFVNKPSRYIGSEWNSIKKADSFRKDAVSVCLCFPDLYETGFANTGIEILYQTVNKRDDAFAERAYSVDNDLAELLRRSHYPSFSLETQTPIGEFDIVGFGLPYELCYTNVLEMLDLAGIPLRASMRNEDHPIVLGGGPCVVNPEPMADFFDAFVIGDGEEIIGEIIGLLKEYKKLGPARSRKDLLERLAGLKGLYIPSLYNIRYHPDGTVAEIAPALPGLPQKVAYRSVSLRSGDPSNFPFPTAPVVPFVQAVHDRLNVEIQRGCVWRCRFCQAGFTYRPYRERDREELVRVVEEGLKNTGYDAVTLAGLSSADYSDIVPLLQTLSEKLTPRGVSIGLPSTRADQFTLALAEFLNCVRRQSVTFAPEAGTERLRRVIHKELQEPEIRRTIQVAYQHGWKNIKLYFMYGFPTETQEDLEGIVNLVRASRKENPGLSFTITLSPFVPKPHTPFQWHSQDRPELLKTKLDYLRKNLTAQVRYHGLDQIVIEGLLSRGDRRCSNLLETAWRMGAKFDEWSERFSFALWSKAMDESGISPEFYCHRERNQAEILPWDHLQGGPEKRVLWIDYQNALKEAPETASAERPKKELDIPAPKKVRLPLQRTVQRLRFKMSRQGSVRFLSHLEQIEMVRRAFRRTGMLLASTSGFHPQIKCSFGPAISVGYESDCEYFDAEFSSRIDLKEVEEKISAQLPGGFSLLRVSRIPLFFPSLESLLNCAKYRVTLPGPLMKELSIERRRHTLAEFLGREDLVLEKVKKGKKSDSVVVRLPLKPLILKMEWTGPEGIGGPLSQAVQGENSIHLLLRFGPGKNVKPEKVVALYMDLSEGESRSLIVRRQGFYIEKADGTFVEP